MRHVTYKIRWLLLIGIFFAGFNKQFTMTAFAIANEAVAKYFGVSHYEVDLLSIGDSFLAIFVCLLLSIYGKLVRVRAQCLIVVFCMAIGNLLTAIAFTSRDLYACVILGRILTGISTGIFYVLPATFANKWFPSNEIATAFSIPFVGFSTGGVVSSISIPYLIPAETNASSNGSQNEVDTEHVGVVLSIVFGIGAAVLMGITIFFWIYSRDNPPSPPSEAEAFIMQNGQQATSFNFKSSLRESIKLLTNQPFLLIAAANFMSTSALVLFIVFMPTLIYATFPELPASTIGYMNAAGFACSVASTLFAGRLLDKTGMYKTLSCIGTGLMVIFGAGIFLCHLQRYFVGLCILYPLLFLSRSFTVTTFVEFLMEVSYPKHKTVVSSLHFAIYNLAFFVTASLERLAFTRCGPSCAVLVPIFGNILCLVCLIFVKPNYKRSKVNTSKINRDESEIEM